VDLTLELITTVFPAKMMSVLIGVNETPEYFYMYKGDMLLKVVDDGEFRDIPIREGIQMASPDTLLMGDLLTSDG
jgi:hypothetical protein